MGKLVYLAGPITGCSYDECTDWRDTAVRHLADNGIVGLSPMRFKGAWLKDETHIGQCYEDHPLSSAKGIVTRDRFDAQRCDVLLVNLLGAKAVSIGTVMEIVWADSQRTPIVLLMEESGNPHDHPMLTTVAGYRVTSLEKGLGIINAILSVEKLS